MSSASRVPVRRTIRSGTTFLRPYQFPRSLPQLKHFATGSKNPNPPHEPLRPCGVPVTATEAGPSTVGGILRPMSWLVGIGAAVGLAVNLVLAPDSGTRTGNMVQEYIRNERRDVERARGDKEEDETPRMRKLELAEMEDAKRSKARR